MFTSLCLHTAFGIEKVHRKHPSYGLKRRIEMSKKRYAYNSSCAQEIARQKHTAEIFLPQTAEKPLVINSDDRRRLLISWGRRATKRSFFQTRHRKSRQSRRAVLAREINRFPDRSGTVFCFAECRLLQPIAAGKQKTLKPYLPRRNKLHKAMGTLLPLVSFTDTGTLFAAIFVATRAV